MSELYRKSECSHYPACKVEADLVPVELADRVWLCSYTLPANWSFADFACNPENPRTGDDCDERCGWYLMVREADDEQ